MRLRSDLGCCGTEKIYTGLAETILMFSVTLIAISLYKIASENPLLTKYHAKEMLVLPVETASLLPYVGQSRFTTHLRQKKRGHLPLIDQKRTFYFPQKRNNKQKLFLISNFRRVLNIVFVLLGIFPTGRYPKEHTQ